MDRLRGDGQNTDSQSMDYPNGLPLNMIRVRVWVVHLGSPSGWGGGGGGWGGSVLSMDYPNELPKL